MPVMKQVGTRKELFDLLMSDVKPFSWGVTNGAMRVAQIAHLALHLGMSAEVIREIPAPLLEGFQLKGLAVTEYLERVISAANIQYAKEIASKGSD